MRCGLCGGFYRQDCPNMPDCYPAKEYEGERWLDWGFMIYQSFVLGAILTVLVLIWVKL